MDEVLLMENYRTLEAMRELEIPFPDDKRCMIINDD